MPFPGMFSNSVISCGEVPFSNVFTIASASGCSERRSRLYNIPRTFSVFSRHSIFTTTGCPSVMVPVLSNTMESIFRATSRQAASFIRMPCSAPLPMPTISAVGVANPSAHGQAIIRTVTMDSKP